MDVDHVYEPNVPDSAVIRSSHIVGIGASAGGLSALEQFFDNMPSGGVKSNGTKTHAKECYSMKKGIPIF